ncbi:MAG: hypothetical protein AAGC70_05000 [Pseudomonadota bacterium]
MTLQGIFKNRKLGQPVHNSIAASACALALTFAISMGGTAMAANTDTAGSPAATTADVFHGANILGDRDLSHVSARGLAAETTTRLIRVAQSDDDDDAFDPRDALGLNDLSDGDDDDGPDRGNVGSYDNDDDDDDEPRYRSRKKSNPRQSRRSGETALCRQMRRNCQIGGSDRACRQYRDFCGNN